MFKRWCFTLNNYTAEEEASCLEFFREHCTYGVYGREVGESGTPHLQGFVILHRQQRLSFLRRRLSNRAHFEGSRGTSVEAANYCKKDGDFIESGTVPTVGQGRRSDLAALIEWGDDFISSHGRAPTSPELAREQPQHYIRHRRVLECLRHRAPPPTLRQGEPNEWQSSLRDALEEEADDRTIRFIVGENGGEGKSWFQQWYWTNHDDVQVLGIGKRDDLAYSVDETKRVFLVNVPRNQMQYLQYSILEMIKDRMVYSPKYQSRTKVWTTNVHIVVFSNEYPDMNALSGDRYVIIDV